MASDCAYDSLASESQGLQYLDLMHVVSVGPTCVFDTFIDYFTDWYAGFPCEEPRILVGQPCAPLSRHGDGHGDLPFPSVNQGMARGFYKLPDVSLKFDPGPRGESGSQS